ncbi:MAG: hypothetical protein ACQESF_02170 [Nanobdellota archaeon]
MTYKIFFLVLLLLTACSPTENYMAKEISLEESLAFAGIDAQVHYTDNTANIIYSMPVKHEEDVLLANFYMFGSALEHFPDAKYRLVHQTGDISYFTEVDSKDVKAYIDKHISLDEFREKVNVFVR